MSVQGPEGGSKGCVPSVLRIYTLLFVVLEVARLCAQKNKGPGESRKESRALSLSSGALLPNYQGPKEVPQELLYSL
jgi:hypothetical protein